MKFFRDELQVKNRNAPPMNFDRECAQLSRYQQGNLAQGKLTLEKVKQDLKHYTIIFFSLKEKDKYALHKVDL